jgi:hypothetical protein
MPVSASKEKNMSFLFILAENLRHAAAWHVLSKGRNSTSTSDNRTQLGYSISQQH